MSDDGVQSAQVTADGDRCLADAWDAMTTDRHYHRALNPAEAEAELREHRGTQFAPAVMDAFFRILERSMTLSANGFEKRTGSDSPLEPSLSPFESRTLSGV